MNETEQFIRRDLLRIIDEILYREDVLAICGTDALPELVFTEPYQHITPQEINRILTRKGLLKHEHRNHKMRNLGHSN